jgi:hypothetical protein
MLPAVPITSPTVLVAFAITGGVPHIKSTGNVKSVPPPATAFTAPAVHPAAMRARSSRRVM